MEQVVPVEETAQEEVVEETPKEEPKVEVPVEEPLTIPPPKKKTAQERIDEITRARREAERDAEYWRLKALEKEMPKPPPVEGTLARPVISQFDTTEAYEDALLEWNDRRREVQTRVTETRRREDDAMRKFQENSKSLREVYEDFDEVIETPVFTPQMRVALMNSDNGPEVAYFLGRPENRATAEKIRNLPVEVQLYELGKLETNLLLAKRTKKVPTAPPPITPVGMAGSTDVDPAKMSIDEWMKWDRARQEERYKQKYGG